MTTTRTRKVVTIAPKNHELVERLADEHGFHYDKSSDGMPKVNPNQFVNFLIEECASKTGEVITRSDVKELASYLYALSNLGNNINQIARAFNQRIFLYEHGDMQHEPRINEGEIEELKQIMDAVNGRVEMVAGLLNDLVRGVAR